MGNGGNKVWEGRDRLKIGTLTKGKVMKLNENGEREIT